MRTSSLFNLFIFLQIFLLPATSVAGSRFYEDADRGWYNFEHLRKEEEQDKELNRETLSSLPPTEQLKIVQQKLEHLKAKMVMQPTIENVRDYMVMQNKIFASSDKVSRAWQMALLKYPELANLEENPNTELGAKIKYQIDEANNKQKVQEFAEHFELIYFHQDNCRYCHSFAPVLKSLIEEYNFKLKLINIADHSQLKAQLNITSTPTLIGYNRANDIYVPIAHGFVPLDNLTRNIVMVSDNITKLSTRVEK